MTLAKSPPGTTVGGWELMPHLKPVGHQSTNWMVLLVLIVATAAFTSFGTTQFGLLAVVHRQALQEEAAKSRTSATTTCIVDHEALQSCAIICQLADAIEHKVDDFLTDRVMTASEVVRGILFARNELLRVKELTVRTCAHFVDDGRLQINEDGSRHMLARTSLAEKCVEGIIAAANGLVARHLSIGLDAMLQAEELPASVSNLDTCLTEVDAQDLTHDESKCCAA